VSFLAGLLQLLQPDWVCLGLELTWRTGLDRATWGAMAKVPLLVVTHHAIFPYGELRLSPLARVDWPKPGLHKLLLN